MDLFLKKFRHYARPNDKGFEFRLKELEGLTLKDYLDVDRFSMKVPVHALENFLDYWTPINLGHSSDEFISRLTDGYSLIASLSNFTISLPVVHRGELMTALQGVTHRPSLALSNNTRYFVAIKINCCFGELLEALKTVANQQPVHSPILVELMHYGQKASFCRYATRIFNLVKFSVEVLDGQRKPIHIVKHSLTVDVGGIVSMSSDGADDENSYLFMGSSLPQSYLKTHPTAQHAQHLNASINGVSRPPAMGGVSFGVLLRKEISPYCTKAFFYCAPLVHHLKSRYRCPTGAIKTVQTLISRTTAVGNVVSGTQRQGSVNWLRVELRVIRVGYMNQTLLKSLMHKAVYLASLLISNTTRGKFGYLPSIETVRVPKVIIDFAANDMLQYVC